MTFNEYQEKAKLTAQYDAWEKSFYNKHKHILANESELASDVADLFRIIALSYATLGLTSEAGEVAGKLKKIIRDNKGNISPDNTSDLLKETGDVLWYGAAIATEFTEPYGNIASANIDKLASRKERGVITGSGDNR